MPEEATSQYKLKSISELEETPVFGKTNTTDTDSKLDASVIDNKFINANAYIEVSQSSAFKGMSQYDSKKVDFKAFTETIVSKFNELNSKIDTLSTAVQTLQTQLNGIAGPSSNGMNFSRKFLDDLGEYFLPLNSSPKTVHTITTFQNTIYGTAEHALWS